LGFEFNTTVIGSDGNGLGCHMRALGKYVKQ